MREKFDYCVKLGDLFSTLEGIDLSIEELDLPVSCHNFLKRVGIHNLHQLLLMSGDDIMRVCFGKRKRASCNVIVDKLCKMSNIEFELIDAGIPNNGVDILQPTITDICDLLSNDDI